MTHAQEKRLKLFRKTGFKFTADAPEALRAKDDDVVCVNEYKYSDMYAIIDVTGKVYRWKTIWREDGDCGDQRKD